MEDVIWDGILGLSYAVPEDPALPLFDTIILRNLLKNREEKNQFSYYLGHNRGSIIFGGADMKYKRTMNEEFVWSPVIEKEYWTISLKEVRKEWRNSDKKPAFLSKNGKLQSRLKKIVYEKGMKTIVDTGTYLIYGPHEETEKFLADIYVDKCTEKKKMPNIVFKFKGENQKDGTSKMVEVTMTPDDYILHYKQEAKDDCVVGIAPDYEDTDGWTLGQVFLKAFYTVFDRDNDRIGFVRANINYDALENEKEKDKGKDGTKKFKTMFNARNEIYHSDPSFARIPNQNMNPEGDLRPAINAVMKDLMPKENKEDKEDKENEKSEENDASKNKTSASPFMPPMPQMPPMMPMPYYSQMPMQYYGQPPMMPYAYQMPQMMGNLHKFKRKLPIPDITKDELKLIKSGNNVTEEYEAMKNFTSRLTPMDFINFKDNFTRSEGLKEIESIDFRNFIFKHNRKKESLDIHFPYEKPSEVSNDN